MQSPESARGLGGGGGLPCVPTPMYNPKTAASTHFGTLALATGVVTTIRARRWAKLLGV